MSPIDRPAGEPDRRSAAGSADGPGPSAYATELTLRLDEPADPGPVAPGPLSADRVRSVRRLLRRRDRAANRQFLAEGRQAVTEALAEGAALDLLVAADAVQRHRDLLGRAVRTGVRAATVDPDTFTGLAGTVTPQGVLAVCRAVDVPLSEALADRNGSAPRLVVLCDEIRDPGNLGTVIRCADAFGADAVLIGAASVDLFNPKTVRSTTGSLFHLPIAVDVDVSAAILAARTAGLQVFGADGAAPCTVDDLARSGELGLPTLWVFGTEARGLSAERAGQLDRLVAIERYGRAESLNLSMAAAVLLHASASAAQTASRAAYPPS